MTRFGKIRSLFGKDPVAKHAGVSPCRQEGEDNTPPSSEAGFPQERVYWKPVLNKWGWAAVLLFCLVYFGVILGLQSDRETAFHHSHEIEILTNVLLVVLASLCILSLAKCRKVPEAIIPGVLLFLVFQGLFVAKDNGDTYRACCARVQADMKQLITQIEIYRIDRKQYPVSLNGLHSSTSQQNIAVLDLFAKRNETERGFRYWMQPDEGENRVGGYFIWSRGPDTQFDFEPERLCGILEKEGIQGAQAYFSRNEYNPTNGFKSPGDIITSGGYFNKKVINNWPF